MSSRDRQRFMLVIATAAAICSGSSRSAGWAHPIHATLAEAEWNADSGCFEIALRLDPIDLEQALRTFHQRPVRLEDADIDAMIWKWLSGEFVMRVAAEPLQSKWVGAEISLKTAWLYFEVASPNGPTNVTIQNTILLDVPRQTNTVHFRNGDSRATLTFTADHEKQTLQWSE